MTYQTGGAFRRALEDRLRAQSTQSGTPLVRLRKMVAFERFLARLQADQPEAWILKGGLALQWRLGNRARTTKDIDILLTTPVRDVHQSLVRAAWLDLGDWFGFLVQQPPDSTAQTFGGGVRFHTQALLDGRPFEMFHVDVGVGDPVVAPPEKLTAPALLDFADIQPITFPCYPVEQQVAEKVHAYTRPRAGPASSRVKDLVDILLIAETEKIRGPVLLEACLATFGFCGTHPLPESLPDPPATWAPPFRKLAREVGLVHSDLPRAAQAAQRLLNPILLGQACEQWDPITWAWR